MTPEEFIYLDRDCDFFKEAIRRCQQTMDSISTQQHWGLGEGNQRLISANTLVNRFKTKAKGAGDGNSVWDALQKHYQIVEDIQEAHQLVRARMMQADQRFADAFNSVKDTLPERPPEVNKFGPYILPDRTTR
ncbi:hypothetical protein D5S18_28990 [Nocardia panacis]|uniref:Uncharacterized protein n=2 Tax=Nocardia panacis TaxID=2340916 RepID=A0A3A4JUP3_9NOCA|nr:hypothetical protein D5S18_28990 [Nocardia panacis]